MPFTVKRFKSLDDAETYINNLTEEASNLSFVSHGLELVVSHLHTPKAPPKPPTETITTTVTKEVPVPQPEEPAS